MMAHNLIGEPLIKRPDDNAEALKNRLEAYHKQTMPITGHYAKQGLYKAVDAALPSDEVHSNLVKVFESLRKAVEVVVPVIEVPKPPPKLELNPSAFMVMSSVYEVLKARGIAV